MEEEEARAEAGNGAGTAASEPRTSGGGVSAGFRQRPLPSREELLNQGHSQAEVNALQVQAHQQEVLSQNFTRWVLMFSFVLCIMLPNMLGLFIWLIVSYAQELGNDCDVPLRQWVFVVCANVTYHTNFCGVGSLHTVILKVCCRYDSQGARPAPWHVKLYNILATLLIFAWHCTGLHWVRTSETCEETSPQLYQSVKVFAAFSVVFNIFVYINTVGLYTIFRFMLRNGMLHTDNAAPPGTLSQQAVVKYDAESFQETRECSICLSDFDSREEIRRTHCGHVFHGKCLSGWLKVNRTCPLCRADMTANAKVPPEMHGSDPLPP